MAKEQFIDYYDLLCISSKANAELVESAVRAQLRRYSPQNKQTMDAAKFELVKQAYLTLSNPKSRTSYDAEYKRRAEGIQSGSHGSVTPAAMRDEIRKRHSVLTVLYERMLKKPQDADLTGKEISAGVGLSFENLEFPLWFLREKGLISRTDVGDLRITAEGVEWLENAYGVRSPSEGHAAESDEAETTDAEDISNPETAVDVSMLSLSEVAVSQ
ncbi:MAG TPA: DnaJ domain-containing protein [Bryobacterales bacterium]|nr:DnaJ domain-containing protein [Bryobacterales bacterium]